MTPKLQYMRGVIEIPRQFVDHYTIEPGWFGYCYYSRIGGGDQQKIMFQWTSCRDTFQGFPKSSLRRFGVFFTHEKDKGWNTAQFMNKVEKILRLEKFSGYRKTDIDIATQIRYSPFWIETQSRRSLFSLLLRCSLHYDPEKDNFDEAIKEEDDAADCIPSIKRFLRGYTKYTREDTDPFRYNTHGWWEIFSGLSVARVSRLLVRGDGDVKRMDSKINHKPTRRQQKTKSK